MKIKFLMLAVAVAAFLYPSIPAADRFSPAEMMPREALVYCEVDDLPRLMELIEGSETGKKYLESRNFEELKNRRLAMRIFERWKEFSDGLGAPLDFKLLGTLTEKRAAIGIYDIGKLDFVMLAPSPAAFDAASVLAGSREGLEEHMADGGTKVFETEFYTDHGRQRQKLLFAQKGGVLVIATNESLVVRTLRNIGRGSKGGSLADEPAFSRIRFTGRSSLLNVWVDQAELNRNYYFKKYWLGSRPADLSGIRAGSFSLELEDGNVIEDRRYLSTRRGSVPGLRVQSRKTLNTYIPSEYTITNMRTASARSAAKAISKIVLAGSAAEDQAAGQNSPEEFDLLTSGHGYGHSYHDYYGEQFERYIDEEPEIQKNAQGRDDHRRALAGLERVLGRSAPVSLLTVGHPASRPFPMFADFRFGLALETRDGVDEKEFKNAVYEIAKWQTGAAGQDLALEWDIDSEGSLKWQRLKLPMLGRELCFVKQGKMLIFSNSREMFSKMLSADVEGEQQAIEGKPGSLTTINFAKGRGEFERLFGRLNKDNDPRDLFKGEIAGVLGVLSGIDSVRIEESSRSGILEKKITFVSGK